MGKSVILRPDVSLDRGEYTITVVVEHSGGRRSAGFTFRYLSDSFAEFRVAMG